MPGYDEQEIGMPGRSKEIDAEALAALREAKMNAGFKTNAEDPNAGANKDEPAGNR